MTPAKLATYVRYKTKTNSTTFPDAEILAYMEVRQDEMARKILSVDEDILLVPMTTSLVANQREYPFDDDIISRIKRVEVKLDGTNFIPLYEIDLTSIKVPISTENDITNQFENEKGNAFYDLLRKSIYIYSGTITEVTDGLKAWINTYPTPITDLSSTTDLSEDPSVTTHGIPRALHGMWAKGVIIDYKESREKPIPLSENERNYDKDLATATSTLKRGNYDREVIGHVPTKWADGTDL